MKRLKRIWVDSRFSHVLPSGRYVFRKDMGKVSVVRVNMRETMIDVGG